MRAEHPKNTATHHGTGTMISTRRDPNGRLLAPVKINGCGPFQLIVNTGAGRSAITSSVATALGLPLDDAPPLLVHGVTGSIPVPTVRVGSMCLGGMDVPVGSLPVIADPIGGADGYLSLSSLGSECIAIDLVRNTLALLKGAPPVSERSGTATLRMDQSRRQMLAIGTRVQRVEVTTIIDTGAQATLGNLALHYALTHRAVGATELVELVGGAVAGRIGTPQPLPMMEIGSLRIFGARIAYGDLPLFGYLNLSAAPAMLLGMDIVGQFAGLLLDYKHRTVQFRPRTAKRW